MIVSEIYALALEDAGYPVDRNLNLGARELVLPELESGNLDLLPEYLGSALVIATLAADPTVQADRAGPGDLFERGRARAMTAPFERWLQPPPTLGAAT